jgi:hypothetical protein
MSVFSGSTMRSDCLLYDFESFFNFFFLFLLYSLLLQFSFFPPFVNSFQRFSLPSANVALRVAPRLPSSMLGCFSFPPLSSH